VYSHWDQRTCKQKRGGHVSLTNTFHLWGTNPRLKKCIRLRHGRPISFLESLRLPGGFEFPGTTQCSIRDGRMYLPTHLFFQSAKATSGDLPWCLSGDHVSNQTSGKVSSDRMPTQSDLSFLPSKNARTTALSPPKNHKRALLLGPNNSKCKERHHFFLCIPIGIREPASRKEEDMLVSQIHFTCANPRLKKCIRLRHGRPISFLESLRLPGGFEFLGTTQCSIRDGRMYLPTHLFFQSAKAASGDLPWCLSGDHVSNQISGKVSSDRMPTFSIERSKFKLCVFSYTSSTQVSFLRWMTQSDLSFLPSKNARTTALSPPKNHKRALLLGSNNSK
jgi:hypothetical protein